MSTNVATHHSVPLPASAEQQSSRGLLSNAVQQAFVTAAPALQTIEKRVKSCLKSDAPALTEISAYLLALGGKRIRPLLAVISARLFEQKTPSPALVDIAAGIELIHMATLLHDDIIDQSPTRRSKTSAYQKYGLTDTLLTGDFLLVKAFGLCATLDRFIIDATERACIELTEGEVLEGKLDFDRRVTLPEYIDIISKKTASLFRLAAGAGAHVAGASAEDVKALQEFGLQAGIAFQMIDDILDIVADADLLGKPSGTDLRQRTPSLVNLLWLESNDPGAAAYFYDPLSLNQTPAEREIEVAAIIARLRVSPVVDQSRAYAKQYAANARNALHSVKSPTCKESQAQLLAILDYTLERCL